MSLKPGFIIYRSSLLSPSRDSYVVRFSYNRLCLNSARRDWVLTYATLCFDDKEVHRWIHFHRLCFIAWQPFAIVSDTRIEHGSIGTIGVVSDVRIV